MKTTKKLERVTIRFAGDSGDGMQLTGTQFTRTTAMAKNDLSTVPDFPAEIRAPAGTLYGVSGFQIQFSSEMIHTPGDQADVLVAMNPAALKSGLRYLKKGGTIIVNTDAFTSRNLRMADFEEDPLDNGFLKGYEVFSVEMTRLTKDALEGLELTHKEKERCKNFFALGMIYWLYNRSIDPTLAWIEEKFQKKPVWVEANKRALRGGRNFADMTEIFTVNYEVPEAKIEPGIYRRITGNEALSLGLVAVSNKSDVEILYCSYPITPASDILQYVSNYKNYGVKSFQTEDEIAAIGAAIGASFAGNLGVTGTSGPGFALKAEFAGLAVICELPLLIVDVQRGGPSTGMPTKPEQTDLMQGMYGRNGEAPIPIIAADSPADCFQTVYDAARVAFQFMTPVLILSDAYLANGAEPWRIPDIDAIPDIKPNLAEPGKPYQPYERDDDSLARKWALPGMPGLEHRIGGLERQETTGNVSYDPENPVSTVGGKNLYLPSGPYDQSVIETREDVLVFTGPVLKEDLEVTGRWKAVIYLSSSAPSADVAVSVTDVYPDGKSVLIAEGIQTITGSFERRKPIEVDLSSVSMVFAAGHRIRVNISGSNYPHFDKNPHPANNALHVGFHRPSHLLLPVIHP